MGIVLMILDQFRLVLRKRATQDRRDPPIHLGDQIQSIPPIPKSEQSIAQRLDIASPMRRHRILGLLFLLLFLSLLMPVTEYLDRDMQEVLLLSLSRRSLVDNLGDHDPENSGVECRVRRTRRN